MPELLDAFLDWLGAYRSTLTAPGLQNLVVIVAGWIVTVQGFGNLDHLDRL